MCAAGGGVVGQLGEGLCAAGGVVGQLGEELCVQLGEGAVWATGGGAVCAAGGGAVQQLGEGLCGQLGEVLCVQGQHSSIAINAFRCIRQRIRLRTSWHSSRDCSLPNTNARINK